MKKQRKDKNKKIKSEILILTLGLIIIFLVVIAIDIKVKGLDNKNNISINSYESGEVFQNETNTITNNLMLINKSNRLKPDFEPNDLVVPSIKFQSVGNMMVQYVKTDVAKQLEKMFGDAKNDGIYLTAISGYRSYDYQDTLYTNEVINVGEIEANRYMARPGESEHQSGLAMDILCDEYTVLDEGFEDTEAFLWMEKNMTKYGFVLRYPKGKEEITGYGYEPWHLRYVGIGVAEEIMKDNLTLEEYLNN